MKAALRSDQVDVCDDVDQVGELHSCHEEIRWCLIKECAEIVPFCWSVSKIAYSESDNSL